MNCDIESDDDDAEYMGFTQHIREQRQLQRASLLRSNSKCRLPTKVYIDTNRSLAPYRPDLISHAAKTGESKNPLLAIVCWGGKSTGFVVQNSS